MGGMKDYNRGFNAGYNPIGSGRIPRNFTEMVGQQAGRAARERQQPPPPAQRAPAPTPGAPAVPQGQARPMTCREDASPRARLGGGLGLVIVGLVGIALLLPGGTGKKLIVMLAAAAALTQTARVARALGPWTPIYAGTLIGLLLGCIELLITGARFGLYNLWIFLFLGAGIGALGVPLALARRAKRAKPG